MKTNNDLKMFAVGLLVVALAICAFAVVLSYLREDTVSPVYHPTQYPEVRGVPKPEVIWI